MLKIGIKYCGGCNPTYDRVEMVQRIKSHHQNRFLFHDNWEPEIDVIVLINGCLRACLSQDIPLKKISSYSITGQSDFKNLIDYLLSHDKKGDER